MILGRRLPGRALGTPPGAIGEGAQNELRWNVPENFCCEAETIKKFERWLAHPRLKDYMVGVPPVDPDALRRYENVLALRGKIGDIARFE